MELHRKHFANIPVLAFIAAKVSIPLDCMHTMNSSPCATFFRNAQDGKDGSFSEFLEPCHLSRLASSANLATQDGRHCQRFGAKIQSCGENTVARHGSSQNEGRYACDIIGVVCFALGTIARLCFEATFENATAAFSFQTFRSK